MKKQDCLCGSGKKYSYCCGVIPAGSAPTPEILMRSRYTAFCKGDADYLLATLAPEKRAGQEDRLKRELSQTMANTRWIGLTVLDRGLENPHRGFVEFIAFFEQDGSLGQLHERSVFIRENRSEGRWYYLDGEILPPVSIARNQPCVCGSGLKFKRCHGKES